MTPLDAEPILQRVRALGFDLAGVCEARPTARERELREWIEAGMHGEMEWLAEQFQPRLDPANLVPGARSVLCVGLRYHDGSPDGPLPKGHARVARYARGTDYHRLIKAKLRKLAKQLAAEHPGHSFRACCDIEPVLEREHAARAGLGRIGKHTLLIAPGAGSWVLLGEIITTLPLRPTVPLAQPDPCGTCTRCIDACPTGAITPFRVDATRCISYLTIEHRTALPPGTRLGEWLIGCDTCQEVCPHNAPTASRREQGSPAPTEGAAYDLLSILGWSEEDRLAAFARSARKRVTLPMLRRNAAQCAADATCPGASAPSSA